MKENLLVNLDLKTQVKKWRTLVVILACLVFILIIGNFRTNKKISNSILTPSIVEVEINGIITDDDYRDNKLKNITKNNNIKAVIINVDSPGGMVTPSEILYDIITELNKTKPTVILMNGMATSGAYMLSIASDYLIARNTTLTGSIGVLMQSFEVVGLAQKLGIALKTFKSSELKGMPSYFETNNQKSNIALQSSIDDIYSYFIELVKSRRKISEENFKLATNGQAFTGRQALKIGLIDEIGDKNSALNYLKTRNVDIKLPIIKVDLKKSGKINIIEKFVSQKFFDYKNNSYNIGLMSIYQI